MNLAERLIEADRTAPRRVLVIGDGMRDVYVHGYLAGDCQEGCPKLVKQSTVIVPGGAANAARSLKNWHAEVLFFGQPDGPVKKRYVAGDTNRCVLRVDDDRHSADFPFLREMAMAAVCAVARRPDAVLLSDYDKGMLSPEFVREVAGECRDRGIVCVADAKRAPEVYAGCALKCNQEYAKRWNYLGAVCTDGPRPPFVGLHRLKIDLPPVECANHVGAGDCFAAHLVLALACGFSLEEAAAVAHSAGRVYVGSPHNHPPHPGEVAADAALAFAGAAAALGGSGG